MNVFIRLPVTSQNAKVKLDVSKISTLAGKAFAPTLAYAYWLFQDRDLVSNLNNKVQLASQNNVLRYSGTELKVDLMNGKSFFSDVLDTFSNEITMSCIVRVNPNNVTAGISCLLGNLGNSGGSGFFLMSRKIGFTVRNLSSVEMTNEITAETELYLAYSLNKLTKKSSWLIKKLDGTTLLSGEMQGSGSYVANTNPLCIGTYGYTDSTTTESAYYREFAIFKKYKNLSELSADFPESIKRVF